MTICSFEDVTIKYGRKTACEGVSLAVEQGAVYALLGRNGAGKSSLVRCLLGQQKPKKGRTLLFGADAWKTRRRAMERTGVVPEQPDAPSSMTADGLSRFCGRLYSRWDVTYVAERFDRFGVDRKALFGSLSRGQQQAVQLALALGHHPELLVLDDPTLGLDVVAREILVEELIGELADRGTTVLVTTHDLARFEGIATHVGVLAGTNVLLDEEIGGLKGRFRKIRYRGDEAEALKGFEVLRKVAQDWGVEAVVGDYSDEKFSALAGKVEGAEADAMSLEEVFVAVAGDGASQ